MSMCTQGSVELSASNTGKKQHQRRKTVRIHASSSESTFFFQPSFKGVNCSTTFQIPMDLASKFRRKTKLVTAFWPSNLPPLRTSPENQDSLCTRIFADMKVRKTPSLPLETSICGSWRKDSHPQATFLVNPLTDVHPP